MRKKQFNDLVGDFKVGQRVKCLASSDYYTKAVGHFCEIVVVEDPVYDDAPILVKFDHIVDTHFGDKAMWCNAQCLQSTVELFNQLIDDYYKESSGVSGEDSLQSRSSRRKSRGSHRHGTVRKTKNRTNS